MLTAAQTHMIDEHLLLLQRILVLALSTRTKCYCFFFFQFYFMHRLTKIIVEIFLPSNLLSIERATANAHISMNFVLREGCAALYFTLPFLSSVEWYIWLSYMATFTCTYVCMWFSFLDWIWPLVAISRHLCFHSSTLRTVFDRWLWHVVM